MAEPVIVLSGGLSHERDISLRSGRRVTQALQDLGVDVLEHDVDSHLITLLREHPGAVVLPLLHGEAGEDGALREVLDLLDVPYVGSSGAACRVAFDKSIATRVVAASGVRTPVQVALPHEIFRELGAAALVRALGQRVGFPMMVKPARSGSALGCTRVDEPAALPAAMVAAYAYGTVAVVEEFLTGTEVAVAVVETGAAGGGAGTAGPRALPAVEIRPESGSYDYAARYTAGETRFLCPAEISAESATAAAEMALDVHRVLGLAHLSRTDIIIDDQGRPVFLETNVAPGLTPTSTVPIALETEGLGFGEVVLELVELARHRRAG